MTYDEMLELIQSAKNGKKVQLRSSESSLWRDCGPEEISFDFARMEYRIKPEEKKPREVWLGPYGAGQWLVEVNKQSVGAKLFREVLE